jgi:hypothetical protein
MGHSLIHRGSAKPVDDSKETREILLRQGKI